MPFRKQHAGVTQSNAASQEDHRTIARGGLLGRGLGAVTGLAAEAIASRKSGKAAPTTYSDKLTASSPHSHHGTGAPDTPTLLNHRREDDTFDGHDFDSAGSDFDHDEDVVDLDEISQDVTGNMPAGLCKPPVGNKISPATIEDLARSFVENFPPPKKPVGTLEKPVILPQRRPGNKRRGFVQAYAPMLEQAGIGQAAFLSFCEYFEQAIKVSPLFDIVNVGANVVGFIPTPTAQIFSAVVSLVDMTVQEMYTRNRTNDFLGQMNEIYFKPHGLFCMIVAYKPEEPEHFNETIDINSGAVKNKGAAIPEQTKTGKYRLASAKTKGEAEMPEPAPLIFPHLEKWVEEGGEAKKPETASFLKDYFDRRAQATFAYENPNAVIAAQPNFATKLADPNYQAQYGGRPGQMIVGTMTGTGPSQRTTQIMENRHARSERRGQRNAQRGPRPIAGMIDGVQRLVTGKKPDSETAGQGPISRVRSLLKEDVLYMIVAPLPSDEIRAEAEKVVKDLGIFS